MSKDNNHKINTSFKNAVLFKIIRFVKNGDNKNDNYYQKQDKSLSYVDYIARWNSEEQEYQASTFNLNGDFLEPKEIQKLISNKNSKQLLWDTVISFPKAISDKIDLTDPNNITNGIKKALYQLWKNNGLDPDNMNAWFALHLDTDNVHIHLGFLEKNPKFRQINPKTKKIEYSFKQKGQILGSNQKYLYQFIKQATLSFNNEIDYQEVLGFRNETINEFKELQKHFQDLEKTSEFKKIIEKFPENKFYKAKDFFYNNQNLETKKIVNDLVLKKVYENPKANEAFKQFLKTVKKTSWKSKELDKLFNIKEKNKFWVENVWSKNGIMPRLGNVLLKTIRNYVNEKFKTKLLLAKQANYEIYLIKKFRKKQLKNYKKTIYEISFNKNKKRFTKLHLETAEKIKCQIEYQAEHYKRILDKQIIKEEINQKISKLN